MWDLRVAHPFGRLSTRSIFLFVAAIIATAFAFIFITAPTTHAADATWDGDAISHEGMQFQKSADARDNDSRGFAKGTHIYSYVPTNTSGSDTQKIYLIYFAPNVDPDKAKSATIITYDYTPPSTYKNPSGKKTITLDPKTNEDKGTTCMIPGIGWIICPVSNFMSSAMDNMYGILTQFLAVRPMETNTSNSLFKAWSIMRNFANVAFVIAFLVIIYSQITTVGISNYGIKKMLPRLVVAAVLVNISYWICAIAIDVSNILGYSIEDLFMGITDTISKTGSQAASDVYSWESLTTTILSGGTLAAAGITALISIGSISGAIYLLLPVLLGVLVAALVAIIVMAARQALIVILVILAPLAFVAYLLPNTEKYFERWKDTFMTMLMLFPIFGVLFGGAQLAGEAIIQNASSIIMLILGMAVKIAPLAVLPFAIKFSGSLLGRIAGHVNDRSKGLVDRTRNMAQERADLRKDKALAAQGWRRNINPLTRAVQRVDTGARKRDARRKLYQARTDNRWHGSDAHEKLDMLSREEERNKQILEQHHDADWNRHVRTDAASRQQEYKLRTTTDQASLAKAQVEGMYEDYKAANSADEALDAMQRNAVITSQHMALAGMRQEAAKRKQTAELSDAIMASQEMRNYAGGVLGSTGQDITLSKAITAERSEFEQNVGNNQQLMKHFNVSNPDKALIATGHDVTVERDGVKYTFHKENPHAREAAIADVLKSGSYTEIESVILASGKGGANEEYAGTISRDLASAGVPGKALYFGSKIINDIGQGRILGEEGRKKAIEFHISEGKIKEEAIAQMDAGALRHMFDVAIDKNESEAVKAGARKLRQQVETIQKTEILRRHASQKSLEHMEKFMEESKDI